MAWGTFNNAQNGDYRISVDIDVNDIKLKPGTYSVMCYTSYDISEDEIYVVEDTMIYFNVYVTNKMALMTRSFLADNSRPGSPEVKKICIARGQTLTEYYLRFEPTNTTDNRYADFTSSNADVLEVADFGGFLALNAKQFGTATVTVSNIRKGFTIPVEICTDNQGHDYSKEVVDSQPTCTEEGLSLIHI